MDFRLEFEFSKADFLKDLANLKDEVDALRPLPEDVEGRVMQKLRLDWNYHSNAIEGNKLSYGETVAFLMEGITAKGKPLKDHLDIRGHNEAINFLLAIVKDTRPITEAGIRALHKLILVEPYHTPAQTTDGLATTKYIMLGEYKTSANHVKTATGEMHYYASPEETPAKMQELMLWFNEAREHPEISPIVAAALFHHKFVAIHPFDDGNGRLSRILMNLILMQNGYPPVVIKMDDRKNYYALLSRADNSDTWPFIEYIAERLESSLRLYLRAAKGEDIDEDEDIDKEIALLRMELKSRATNKVEVTSEEIFNLTMTEILPLISVILAKISVIDEFFRRKSYFLRVIYSEPQSSLNQSRFFEIGGDINQHFEIFFDPQYRIISIDLSIELSDFNNPDNLFTLKNSLVFDFQPYHLEISNSGTRFVKAYNQLMTQNEKNQIIKSFVKNLKYLIGINLK